MASASGIVLWLNSLSINNKCSQRNHVLNFAGSLTRSFKTYPTAILENLKENLQK